MAYALNKSDPITLTDSWKILRSLLYGDNVCSLLHNDAGEFYYILIHAVSGQAR